MLPPTTRICSLPGSTSPAAKFPCQVLPMARPGSSLSIGSICARSDRPVLAALRTESTTTFADHLVVIFEKLLAALTLVPLVVDLHGEGPVALRVDPLVEGWDRPHVPTLPRTRDGAVPSLALLMAEELSAPSSTSGLEWSAEALIGTHEALVGFMHRRLVEGIANRAELARPVKLQGQRRAASPRTGTGGFGVRRTGGG